MSNNSTFVKSLVKVGIDGAWIAKNNSKNSNEFHYHLRNQSLCHQSVLLIDAEFTPYRIRSSTSQKQCKACFKSQKRDGIISQIDSDKKKFQTLYNTQDPENAIINYISHPEIYPARYDSVRKMFEENFPDFSLDDVLSFMVINKRVTIENQTVIISIPNGESIS